MTKKTDVIAYEGPFPGAVKYASANLYTDADDYGIIAVICLGNGKSKVLRMRGNAVVKRLNQVAKEIRAAGSSWALGKTLLTTLHHNYSGSMSAIREVIDCTKSGTIEFVAQPYTEVKHAVLTLVRHYEPFKGSVAVQPAAAIEYNQTQRQSNRKASVNPDSNFTGVDALYRARCSALYPTPVVPPPRRSWRALIRSRVDDNVRLTCLKEGREATSEDYRFAWLTMWEDYDRESGHSLLREYRSQEDETGDTILALAEEHGLLEEVYAFVCDRLYVDDIMPRLEYVPTHTPSSQPMSVTVTDTAAIGGCCRQNDIPLQLDDGKVRVTSDV